MNHYSDDPAHRSPASRTESFHLQRAGGRMKLASSFVLAGVLLAPLSATAGDLTTGRYPACTQTHWLEAMVQFAAEGRDDIYNSWIDRGKCIELRKGLEVEILGHYGDLKHPRVEFVINGYRFFTVREAIATQM